MNSDASQASALARLVELLREQGGLMATLVAADAPERSPGDVRRSRADGGRAARGPSGAREEYELLVEAIYEGYLLHYGAGRVVRSAGGRSRPARRRSPVRARPGAPGRARRHRGRGRARRHDHAQRARPGRRRARACRGRVGGRRAGGGLGLERGPRAAPSAGVRAGAPEAIEAMRTSAAGVPASP